MPGEPTRPSGKNSKMAWTALVAVLVFAMLAPVLLPQASAAPITTPDGWQWQNPLPQGQDLYGVWGTSATDVFVVGDLGTILHYDGSAWSNMSSGTSANLRGICGTSSSDVYAVGDGGTILHYDGSTWTRVFYDVRYGFNDVWCFSPEDVFAGGRGPSTTGWEWWAVLRYDGSSWGEVGSGNGVNPSPSVHCVWGTSSTDVYAGGRSSNGFLMRFDGGTWTSLSTSAFYGVWGSSFDNVFAVGQQVSPPYTVLIYHYDGETWNITNCPTGAVQWDVWGTSSTDVFTVGDSGSIVHYNGMGWAVMASPTTRGLKSIWGSSSSNVFAVGQGGTILQYDGKTWKQISTYVTASQLRAIWGNSASDVYAVGDSAAVVHYDGITWISQVAGASETVRDVWGTSSSDIHVVGKSPSIIHWNGQAWSPMEVPTDIAKGTLYGVWCSSASDVFAVGFRSYYPTSSYDIVLHYDGTSWSQMDTGTALDLRDVWGASSSDVFAVAASGDILHYDGDSWSTVTKATKGLNGIWGTSASDIFAVGLGGTILHHDGSIWGIMASGTTADLYGVWGASSSDVYAVGAGGTILHFDGDAWTSLNSGTTKALNAVGGSSTNDVFAVGESGTILHLGETVAAYTLTTAVDPSGSGTVVLLPSKPGNTYAAGSKVTLVAIANQGYQFDRWTGDLSGSENPANIAMDSDKVVMANFTGNPTNEPPSRPTNAWPAAGATDTAVDPSLVSSAFSDPDDGDTHAASHWQVSQTSGDYSGPLFDSGTDTVNLVNITVPEGELDLSSTYYWRVRYLDNRGAWSEWSSETSFTTEATPNQPPAQPGNVSPANEAADVNLSPTLQSSAFSDPDSGDTHAASQWQVTATSADYISPVFDSGADQDALLQKTLPSDMLNSDTTYFWRVRHQDDRGKWSAYSAETSFTTAVTQSPAQPSNVSPLDGAIDVSSSPTLSCSAFSDPDSGDTHAASQWQITAVTGNYSSPVFDSGGDNTDLTELAVPSGTLGADTTYYWRVRHQDNHGEWSDYSNETSFTTTSASGDEGGKGFPFYIVGVVSGVMTLGASTGYLWRRRRLANALSPYRHQLKQWEEEGYDVSAFRKKWPRFFRQ